MNRIALLGCGSIGYTIAYAFSESKVKAEFLIYDSSQVNLNRCISLPLSIANYKVIDLSNEDVLREVIKSADLIIDALPSFLGFKVMKLASKLCRDVISVSYIPEDPLVLNSNYIRCNSYLIPDAGFAPGLSNIFVGRALTVFTKVDEVRIYVGGLPEEPIGPLRYVITWSPEDLIEEYVRPARIIEDYKIKCVDPFSSVERVVIPKFGVFEAFYTNGLRTLLHTLKGRVRYAFERTLRYEGHLGAMKLLRDLGLMDDRPVTIGSTQVIPKKFLAKILDLKLRMPNVRDIAILYLEVVGTRKGVKDVLKYLVWTKYDDERRLSALSKVTGFTTYAIAKLALENRLGDLKGVVPPENLGMHRHTYRLIISELASKGISIEQLS